MRFGRNQRAGVAFEERDVGAEAADRDLDGERAAPRHGRQRAADERRLAVAPRRDEEDLLTRGEVLHEALELDHAVDECRGRHDLSVDERILRYVKQRNDYVV